MTLPELRLLIMAIYADIDTAEVALNKLQLDDLGPELFADIAPILLSVRPHTSQVVAALASHIPAPQK